MWEEEQQKVFEKLKKALPEAPILAKPDFSKTFKVQSDASNLAVGSILTQEDDDEWKMSGIIVQPEKNNSLLFGQ